MDDAPTQGEGYVERSCEHKDEEDNLEMDTPLGDDFSNYDCFLQPFYFPDEDQDQKEELEIERLDQIADSCSCRQGFVVEGNRKTSNNHEDFLSKLDLDFKETAYHHNLSKLQRLVEDKFKELEEITAEKEELERSVQTALQKLWAKEAELHSQRKTSFEREKCLIDDLRQESAHSEELEIQVQTLKHQKNVLQEQLINLEEQLSMVKGETEERRKELDHKLPELENTQESLKKMTVHVVSVSNKPKSRVTTAHVSSSSTEGDSSGLSSSEQCNDSEESLEDDLSAEVKFIDLQEQNRDLRKAFESLTANIADLWREVNPNCSSGDVEKQLEEEEEEESMILLNRILQAFYQQKEKVSDLEEQNAQLKHLQGLQEAHCLTEGRIHRLWFKFGLHGEKEETQTTWPQGIPSGTEETDIMLQKIEQVLSSNKFTLQENQELNRLNASQEKKVVDLKALVKKLREEHRQILTELEKKNTKLEETKLSANKAIEDRDVELEILKEQVQESERKEEQLKAEKENCERDQCTDGVFEKLLRIKERAFEDYQKKCEQERAALRDEVSDLQEALERASRDKDDLQEYCDLLKEDVKKSEILINSLEEGEKSLKEILDQGKKKEEKLYLTARELYDEILTRKQEALSQESAIVVLQAKIKSLELELGKAVQERQIDKKNLKNAKETEGYLQSTLQQALREVIQIKTKNEDGTDGQGQETFVETPDELPHQPVMQDQLQELETFVEFTMERNTRDLQEYAARIEELCEENRVLKKEVDTCKESSRALVKTNCRLKTLSCALKDDLVEEIKGKKELELSLMKSNEKTESTLKEDRGFDEQSTISQLPSISEVGTSGGTSVSPSDSTLLGQKRSWRAKALGKTKIVPKVLSKHFSSSSVNVREKKDKGMVATTSIENPIQTNGIGLKTETASVIADREQRLRNLLMTVQRDKDHLQQEVAHLNDDLQRARTQLQIYGDIKDKLSRETTRNVRERLEMKKALEAIYGKTNRAYTLINTDIHSLSEASKMKDKQLRKFEWLSGKVEKENVDLMKTVAALKDNLQDEVTLKEVAIEEARQMKESLQKVIESKERSLLHSEPPLLINNLNTDVVLPQMGKHEVRTILKEVLRDVECSSSEEVNRLKQRSVELMEELCNVRRENEYLKGLIDNGVHDELQRAEERIAYLNGQLKICQERQNVLREAAIKDKVAANKEEEKFFERYAELKIILKGKEDTLERYEETEDVLVCENTRLQEEIKSLQQRFGVDELSPTAQKAEAKRALEGWKRKCQRLQENFDRESEHLQEENNWLHKQLNEESLLCDELRRCKTRLEESLKSAEERIKELYGTLEERQESLACLEERRVVIETKLSCLQKVNDDLQNERSKERSEAEQSLIKIRNEFAVTAKDLKRHQQEGNNLVTKVFLLENAKEKLEHELQEKDRKMVVNLESFTEERSRLSERVRDLRISLEEEVRRRLDLEEKMQQIVKISVMEREQNRLNGNHEVERNLAGVFKWDCNNAPAQSSADGKILTLPLTLTTEASETTEQGTEK